MKCQPQYNLNNELRIESQAAKALSLKCLTIEAFVAASVEDICTTVPRLNQGMAAGYKTSIEEVLKRGKLRSEHFEYKLLFLQKGGRL